jgi:hypothetical protein
MKKIVNKGYTITVTSWETNNYERFMTKSKTVETKEEAKIWFDMMQLCKSKSDQPGFIRFGNSFGFDDKQKRIAGDFIKKYHDILIPKDIKNYEDNLVYWFCNLASRLLGNSDYYLCRAMETCVITYSPEDIYAEEIIF